MTEPSDPATAQRVINSRYRIESLLGRGGMADVYLAHDLFLDRQVAVKMLRADLARDSLFQTRFQREAQSSASLNHPNIVSVYDAGRTGVEGSQQDEVKTPYIVMEYVVGVTLRHRMHGTPYQSDTDQDTTDKIDIGEMDTDEVVTEETVSHSPTDASELASKVGSGEASGPAAGVGGQLGGKIDELLGTPVSEQEAAGYMSGVLQALSYSHSKGIVHRDIKPSNVMICSNDEVKVMDFGIARALAAASMTQTSTVVGTAQYLSPEQARGEVVDHRSDLYSAGCVLFELLTNRPPFEGESAISVAYQQVREDPPAVTDLNPQVSPAVESVVAKALAKSPADRFQSAEEFHQALQDALDGIPVAEAPTVVTAAVDSGVGRRDFSEVIGGTGAAAVRTPLSARTPEDPARDDSDQHSKPRGRRGGRAWLWTLLLVALLAGGGWALAQMLNGQQVEVPDVAGMERSEALELLAEADIAVTDIQESPHPDIEPNYAIGTDPEVGTSLDPAEEEVTLYLSSGPGEVTIPDGLQGETEETVRDQLEELGLEIGEVSEQTHPSLDDGTLITTDPEAGSTVDLGSEVDLVLSNGLVELPEVVGLSESAATETLQEQELNVAPSYFETDTATPGTVLATHLGGEEVFAGDSVVQNATITLSVAVEPEGPPAEDQPALPEEPDDSPIEDTEGENGGGDGGSENGDSTGDGGVEDDPGPEDGQTGNGGAEDDTGTDEMNGSTEDDTDTDDEAPNGDGGPDDENQAENGDSTGDGGAEDDAGEGERNGSTEDEDPDGENGESNDNDNTNGNDPPAEEETQDDQGGSDDSNGNGESGD